MPYKFEFVSQTHTWSSNLTTDPCAHSGCHRKVTIGLPYCWEHNESVLHLAIRDSNIKEAGLGVYAYHESENDKSVVFKKGDRIVQYDGDTLNKEQLNELYGKYTAPYCVQLSKDKFVDSATYRCLAACINHHPQGSNVSMQVLGRGPTRQVWIVATKSIYHDDELYMSYGQQYRMKEKGVTFQTVYVEQ